MIRASLQQVLDATGATAWVAGAPASDAVIASTSIAGVDTDTRTLRANALFVGLSGPNFKGHVFAGKALQSGAAAALIEDSAPLPEGLAEDALLLRHEDPYRALADLAGWHRSRLNAKFVGVTGSSGKTTTKDVLASLLSPHGQVVKSPASFNNRIGVPLTLFEADETTEYCIVELGTSVPGRIAALCRIAQPDGGIVTNVGNAHLEQLGSEEGIAVEKSAMLASIASDGFCVINADCRFSGIMRDASRGRVSTFSVEGRGELNATDVQFEAEGTAFTLDGRRIHSPLLGVHNVQNLLAALAACQGLGFDLEQVLPGVGDLSGARGRMERFELKGRVVFDDSYNANPDSARAAVRVLAGLKGFQRRVLVLGDMLELGEFAAELHHQVGMEAARAGLELVICVGDLAKAAAAGALEGGLPPERVVHLDSPGEAMSQVPDLLQEGDVALVKASRALELERVVQALVERFGTESSGGDHPARPSGSSQGHSQGVQA